LKCKSRNLSSPFKKSEHLKPNLDEVCEVKKTNSEVRVRAFSERAVTRQLARVLIFFKQALAYFERP